MIWGKLKAPFLVALACLPCCLPLLGISGAAVLAATGSILSVSGLVWLGLLLLVSGAVVLNLATRKRPKIKPRQPVEFFEASPISLKNEHR